MPFDEEALEAAPHHDPGTALSEADEQDLYRHYGMSAERSADPRHDRAGEPGDRAATHRARPPTTR